MGATRACSFTIDQIEKKDTETKQFLTRSQNTNRRTDALKKVFFPSPLYEFNLPSIVTMHGKLYSSFDRVAKKTNGLTPLQRKPKRNQKYANVKGTLDTGNSFSKVKLISSREYIRKRDELFKRVRPLTVFELVQENEDQKESIMNLGDSVDDPTVAVSPARRNNQGSMQGVLGGSPGSPSGSHHVVVDAKKDTKFSRPYLLLDTREAVEDYNVCRVSTATHYPVDWLRHDKITPALFHYKNKDGKVIVLYALDDRKGRTTANQFVEKGFDNIFLLTGGLEAFIKEYPQMVDGSLPDEAGMDAQLRASARRATNGSNSRAHRPPLAPGNNKLNSNGLTRKNIAKAGFATPGRSGRHTARISNDEAASVAPSNLSTMSRTESLLNWNKK